MQFYYKHFISFEMNKLSHCACHSFLPDPFQACYLNSYISFAIRSVNVQSLFFRVSPLEYRSRHELQACVTVIVRLLFIYFILFIISIVREAQTHSIGQYKNGAKVKQEKAYATVTFSIRDHNSQPYKLEHMHC